jgi:hypothetical protein
VGTKYQAGKSAQPIKLRDATYDYIVREGDANTRTPPGMVEHMKKMHEALVKIFGHDRIDVIVEQIEEWKKKAGGK